MTSKLKPLKAVTLKIETCEKCPHVNVNRDYTEDSFETCFRWDCKLAKGKNILRYRDWHEKDNFIPGWCPLKKVKK